VSVTDPAQAPEPAQVPGSELVRAPERVQALVLELDLARER